MRFDERRAGVAKSADAAVSQWFSQDIFQDAGAPACCHSALCNERVHWALGACWWCVDLSFSPSVTLLP